MTVLKFFLDFFFPSDRLLQLFLLEFFLIQKFLWQIVVNRFYVWSWLFSVVFRYWPFVWFFAAVTAALSVSLFALVSDGLDTVRLIDVLSWQVVDTWWVVDWRNATHQLLDLIIDQHFVPCTFIFYLVDCEV